VQPSIRTSARPIANSETHASGRRATSRAPQEPYLQDGGPQDGPWSARALPNSGPLPSRHTTDARGTTGQERRQRGRARTKEGARTKQRESGQAAKQRRGEWAHKIKKRHRTSKRKLHGGKTRWRTVAARCLEVRRGEAHRAQGVATTPSKKKIWTMNVFTLNEFTKSTLVRYVDAHRVVHPSDHVTP
jgi:hypothetical protein